MTKALAFFGFLLACFATYVMFRQHVAIADLKRDVVKLYSLQIKHVQSHGATGDGKTK